MSAATGNEPFRDLEVQIVQRERRTFAVTATIAAGFILGAIALLAVTYYELQGLNGQLDVARQQLDAVASDLKSSQARLAEVNAARNDSEAKFRELQAATQRQNESFDRLSKQLSSVNAARQAAEAQLAQQRREAEQLRAELAESNRRLEALAAQIRESADLTRYLHLIDFADAKQLYNTAPELGELLVKILSLKDRNLPFNFANNPDLGFTSPGFAGYVLQELRHLPAGPPDVKLKELPSAIEPRLGDVILYETGFAMFYLKDHLGAPFVIGMTPKGVAALEVDFRARRIGVLRTGLDRR